MFSQQKTESASRALKLGLSAALLALGIFAPQRASAHGGDVVRPGDPTTRAQDCANHLGVVPFDGARLFNNPQYSGHYTFYTPDVWWGYAPPGGAATDCENFAYFRVKTTSPRTVTVYPRWVSQLPVDHCLVGLGGSSGDSVHQHTYITYAVFVRPSSQSPWQLQGSGLLIGRIYPGIGCVYDVDGDQVQPGMSVPGDEGTRQVRATLPAGGEIAIIQQNFGHHGQAGCGNQICLYPVNVNVTLLRAQTASAGALAVAGFGMDGQSMGAGESMTLEPALAGDVGHDPMDEGSEMPTDAIQ